MQPVWWAGTDSTKLTLIGWTAIRTGGAVWVITVAEATVVQYCGYIKGIPTEDWGLSNRPEFPPILVVCSNDTDITWIVFRGGRLFKLQAGS